MHSYLSLNIDYIICYNLESMLKFLYASLTYADESNADIYNTNSSKKCFRRSINDILYKELLKFSYYIGARNLNYNDHLRRVKPIIYQILTAALNMNQFK